MYASIKEANGPCATKSICLKIKSGEPITDQRQQMERCFEHSLDFYATQNIMLDTALNAIPNLPVLNDFDAEPTEEVLSKAIDCVTIDKARGNASMPPEIMKSGKDALLQDLHELLCLCWREGTVPKDMCNAKIVTLYKNKGDCSDCNYYRGISLIGIVGEVFVRVLLACLQVLVVCVYPESQCGWKVHHRYGVPHMTTAGEMS